MLNTFDLLNCSRFTSTRVSQKHSYNSGLAKNLTKNKTHIVRDSNFKGFLMVIATLNAK